MCDTSNKTAVFYAQYSELRWALFVSDKRLIQESERSQSRAIVPLKRCRKFTGNRNAHLAFCATGNFTYLQRECDLCEKRMSTNPCSELRQLHFSLFWIPQTRPILIHSTLKNNLKYYLNYKPIINTILCSQVKFSIVEFSKEQGLIILLLHVVALNKFLIK